MRTQLRPSAAGRSDVVRTTPARPVVAAAAAKPAEAILAAPRPKFWDVLRRSLGAVTF